MEETLLKMFNNTKTDLGNFGSLTKQSYTTFDDSFNKVFENANKAFNAEKEYYKTSAQTSFEQDRISKLQQKSGQRQLEVGPNEVRQTENKEKAFVIVSERGNAPEPKIDIKTLSATEAALESQSATAEGSKIEAKSADVETETKNSEASTTTELKDKVEAADTAVPQEEADTENGTTNLTEKNSEAPTSSPEQTQGTKVTQVTQAIVDRILPGATIIEPASTDISSLTTAVKSALAQATTQSSDTTAATVAATTTATSTAQANQTDLDNLDLTNLSKDLKSPSTTEVKTSPDKPKLQAQTQQVLLNLTTETESTQTTTPMKTTDQPLLVKANTEVIASAQVASETTPKQTMKNVMEKIALTQDMLDSAKAKVTSVELSSQSSNLLNQNAQEQGAKLAFEGLNNLLGTQDTTKSASFAKTIDTLNVPKELNKADILAQMHNKMETLKEDGVTKVTIVLKPENLGKVNLELINSKDGLIARMTTENAQVKELLEKSLESLKNSLGAQGVNVNNVSVKVAEANHTPDEMHSFDKEQQHNQNQQSSDENNQTFEEKFANQSKEIAEENSTTSHDGQIDYKI